MTSGLSYDDLYFKGWTSTWDQCQSLTWTRIQILKCTSPTNHNKRICPFGNKVMVPEIKSELRFLNTNSDLNSMTLRTPVSLPKVTVPKYDLRFEPYDVLYFKGTGGTPWPRLSSSTAPTSTPGGNSHCRDAQVTMHGSPYKVGPMTIDQCPTETGFSLFRHFGISACRYWIFCRNWPK